MKQPERFSRARRLCAAGLCLLTLVCLFTGCVFMKPGNDKPGDGKTTGAEPDSQIVLFSLPGSASAPEGYHVFTKGGFVDPTACEDIGIEKSQMETLLAIASYDAELVPKGVPYTGDNAKIQIKIKEKKYGDVNLASVSDAEFEEIASTLVKGFNVTDYDTVRGKGLRYIRFQHEMPGLGTFYRYATIINGRMVYVYLTGNQTPTEQQLRDLEFVAMSLSAY